MANEIKLEGWDKFMKKLDGLPASIFTKVDAIVQDEANKWARLAKRTAPRNKIIGLGGTLVSRIQAVPVAPMSAEVISPTKYSPYVEWGTGTRVNVPSDLTAYAIQFKGVKKVIGQHPNAYFFIHKPAVELSLNNRVNKFLTTPQ